MRDEECVRFLQAMLPELGLRWPGFRKVRRQVCRSLRDRAVELGLGSYAAYGRYVEEHPEEREVLDALCRVTISRFYRDHSLWETLGREVLPTLARKARATGEPLAAWSAGCASGEEPYTLALVWRRELASRFPDVGLDLVATDADTHMLERARRAVYPGGCLEELPQGWQARYFEPANDEYRLVEPIRRMPRFEQADLRQKMPSGPFHLILCRNLAFTYFDRDVQREIAGRLFDRLAPGGFLAVGSHEAPPEDAGFEPWPGEPRLHRRPEDTGMPEV